MDCGHSKAATMNVEVVIDRLSMLPDDLIHKVLSFLSIKYAVRTCVLSSRWRFIWTSMPFLTIPVEDYDPYSEHVDQYQYFVNNVLTRRNNQIQVYSVDLSFHCMVNNVLLKQVLDYAFSHNVQRLSVACSRDVYHVDLSVDLFRSHSLKCLTLIGPFTCILQAYPTNIPVSITWELPVLTTLHLCHVEFSKGDDVGDLLSKCANLKNLILTDLKLVESDMWTIWHPTLSNLILVNECWPFEVVTPQLENLTIRNCDGNHMITAPNLASLIFSGLSGTLQFSADLPSLEKVDISIWLTKEWSAYAITSLLQQIHHVKFLTLNLEFILPLSRIMERISLQLSLFSKLKSLKIYPRGHASGDEADKNVTMSRKVINYLLDGSPSATFRMISYEELKEQWQKARAFATALEARNLMERLQMMLENAKDEIEETKKTHMDRGRTTIESHEAETHDQANAPVEEIKQNFEGKLGQMKSCWEDVGVRIDQCKGKACFIVSQLGKIEELLLKDLPTSKRDELQASFSSLRAEADTVVKKMWHHMDNAQIHLSDCCNELAAISLKSIKD